MEWNEHRSPMLRVVSYIMLIGGILGMLLGVAMIFGSDKLASTLKMSGKLLLWSGILSIISAGLNVLMGILGIKNWQNPQMAGVMIFLGILGIAMCVVNQIVQSSFGASFNFFAMVAGAVLPVLYLIGASQLKK